MKINFRFLLCLVINSALNRRPIRLTLSFGRYSRIYWSIRIPDCIQQNCSLIISVG